MGLQSIANIIKKSPPLKIFSKKTRNNSEFFYSHNSRNELTIQNSVCVARTFRHYPKVWLNEAKRINTTICLHVANRTSGATVWQDKLWAQFRMLCIDNKIYMLLKHKLCTIFTADIYVRFIRFKFSPETHILMMNRKKDIYRSVYYLHSAPQNCKISVKSTWAELFKNIINLFLCDKLKTVIPRCPIQAFWRGYVLDKYGIYRAFDSF